jgi:hypothetical protein
LSFYTHTHSTRKFKHLYQLTVFAHTDRYLGQQFWLGATTSQQRWRSTLRATAPVDIRNSAGAMEGALVNRLLEYPAVQAVDVSQLDGWQELGAVFIKAFDNKGHRYSIDFNDAYVWMQYGRKDNALRALKARFTLDTDCTVLLGQARFGVGVSGSDPDKYYLIVEAFERFAMAAQTEAGEHTRTFFRVIRNAYMELTASGQQPPKQEDASVGKK